MTDTTAILHGLARARATFQLRAVETVIRDTRTAPSLGGKGQAGGTIPPRSVSQPNAATKAAPPTGGQRAQKEIRSLGKDMKPVGASHKPRIRASNIGE